MAIKQNRAKNSFREYLLLNMNAVIRILIFSDIVWSVASGMLGPIFALFIIDFIPGATVATAGIAAAIYLVTKSVFQIPAATIIDAICGEHDDYWVIVIGSFLTFTLPLAYLFIHTEISLYILQFILGLVTASTFPSYMAIFTRHIDPGKEGTEWGVYFTLTDFASAIAASLGGIVAELAGFTALIAVSVIIGFIAAVPLIFLKPYLKLKPVC